jgi:hypothetical protein
MALKRALYYPHTEIKSESMLKTALLLWDDIRVIVPGEYYKPYYQDKKHAEAFELIGDAYVPSQKAKEKAHEMIVDLASKPLGGEFYLSSSANHKGLYEIYPQKFLEKTWRVLDEKGMVGDLLPNRDYGPTTFTGLTMMSLLADCCAGATRVRVTDRSAAYASIAGLLTEPPGADQRQQGIRARLVAMTVDIVDADKLIFRKLLNFRKREQKESHGHQYRALRHRYLNHLETGTALVANANTEEERADLESDFRQQMSDDFKDLKLALKSKPTQSLGTKEFVTAFVAAGAVTTTQLGLQVPLGDLVTAAGAPVMIGGLLAAKSKLAEARTDVLSKHAMSYLYELRGGIRW